MSSASNVPALSITSTGVSVPDTPTVLSGVLADMNDAFGGNLNIVNTDGSPNLSTPQGAMASDTTEYIQSANAELAYLVSQVDPATAEGRMQDAIGRIYMLYRKGATATVVSTTCTGQVGVTLPAGVLAMDTAGNTYASLGSATFNGSGLATVQFACTTLGPVACPSGTLTRIAQAYPGWDAVTNTSAGTTGTATEGRADFEARRTASVAANAHGSPAAIFGAVASVDGVTDCYVIDNPTGSTVNTGSTNYPVLAHSVYVAAVGGTDADVANAIWSKKDLGCNYNGNTSATVTDTSSFANPQPIYTVTWERPSSLAIKFAVQIANNPSLPADIVTQTKNAILAAFNGQDGGSRARIASTIYASRYVGGVATISPVVSVVSLLVGTSSPTLNSVTVGIDQTPTLQASDITVTLV